MGARPERASDRFVTSLSSSSQPNDREGSLFAFRFFLVLLVRARARARAISSVTRTRLPQGAPSPRVAARSPVAVAPIVKAGQTQPNAIATVPDLDVYRRCVYIKGALR